LYDFTTPAKNCASGLTTAGAVARFEFFSTDTVSSVLVMAVATAPFAETGAQGAGRDALVVGVLHGDLHMAAKNPEVTKTPERTIDL
jgi:hypothetical protein